jgi:hypothetical protein
LIGSRTASGQALMDDMCGYHSDLIWFTNLTEHMVGLLCCDECLYIRRNRNKIRIQHLEGVVALIYLY